jgi:hypothetical protein
MKTYYVTMTANASVSTGIQVLAESYVEAEAKAVELAKAGDVVWKYDGADDQTIQVEGCARV